MDEIEQKARSILLEYANFTQNEREIRKEEQAKPREDRDQDLLNGINKNILRNIYICRKVNLKLTKYLSAKNNLLAQIEDHQEENAD